MGTIRRLLIVALAAGAVLLALAVSPAPQASASSTPLRLRALMWAEAQAGKWYCWGGTAGCFDCSGLVYEAYLHQGVNIGRDTYAMLANRHLQWIPASARQRGDLAFYGTGHVELVTAHGTFGALESGTQIGWHHPSGWWMPTMYFRVR
jgi:cell wall-associated NlpC family hydrolase